MLLLAALVVSSRCSILLGGDIMLNSIAPSRDVWTGISATVKSADVALANLEVPLTTARTATPNKSSAEIKARDQFVLKADPSHAPLLANAGFDLVSLGNNHAMDYGLSGLLEMERNLRRVGIGYAGAGTDISVARNPAVFRTRYGVRVALLSAMAFVTTSALRKVTPATEDSAGVNGLDLGGLIDDEARESLGEWVAGARAVSDIVVVGLHWGTERKSVPNPYQVALGRALIDAGADVVWGNHPHVLQGGEIYKGAPILYSCGNLISPLPAHTALFRLAFEDGDFKDVAIFPALISAGKISMVSAPYAKREVDVFRDLCRLLQQRFPDTNSKPLL